MTEAVVTDPRLKVLDGIDLHGQVNVGEDRLLANIASAITRGLPQIWPGPMRPDRVCLVGGGPSLDDTEEELRDLVFAGAKVVTLNGAYHWCLAHNIRPSAQVVMDARASNARFVEPAIPKCIYYLASQCAPETFDACAGREHVGIVHMVNNVEGPAKELLDKHYLGRWTAVAGGTTVGMRTLVLLWQLGYRRIDLFGIDSCFLAGKGHAYPQPENAGDRVAQMTTYPSGHPELGRTFLVAPWHLKQFEDWLQTLRMNGDKFLLTVHGDGLLAYALQAMGDVDVILEDAAALSPDDVNV